MEGIEDYDSDDSTQLQDGIVVVPKENGFLVENTLLIEKIIPHEEKENKGPTLVPLPEPVTIAMDSSSVSVTWVEDFYLPNLCSSQHVDSHCKHRWKGADWSSTMILRSVESKSEDDSEYCAGLFLGISRPDLLAENFHLCVRFKYYLLSQENVEVKDGPSVTHSFLHRPNPTRDDLGNYDIFPQDLLSLHATYLQDQGCYLLRFKVEVRCIFLPARAPHHYDSHKQTGMVGIENLGATCYLNSLLQMLFHIPAFRQAVYNLSIESNGDAELSPTHMDTTLALQSTFVNLQTSLSEVSTRELMKAFGWSSTEALMQQDVQEMMRVLIDKLEEFIDRTNKRLALTATPSTPPPTPNFLKSLFCGKLKSYIRCIDISYESSREEDFYDLQLDVKGCRDIYDSLSKYTAVEMLDGDNQYYCEEHKGKYDAKKGVVFSSFPPILTIHLKRFDFDMYTMNFKKIHDYYEFPSILYLDPFLENSPSSSSSSSSSPWEQALDERGVTENTYVLHSVLVHSGDVGGGHYYAYIRPATTYNLQTIYNLENIQEKISSYRTDKRSSECDTSSDGSDNSTKEEDKVEDAESHWFKFDDEVVLKVCELEAIYNNYGRRAVRRSRYGPIHAIVEGQNAPPSHPAVAAFRDCNYAVTNGLEDANTIDYTIPSFASAYMLVYIRLSEAMALLNPAQSALTVTPARPLTALSEVPIPTSLSDRLRSIGEINDFHSQMVALQSDLVEVWYCLEDALILPSPPHKAMYVLPDLTAWRSQDITGEGAGHGKGEETRGVWHRLLVRRGGQRLGIFLAICKRHRLLPIKTMLWQVKRTKQGAHVLSHRIDPTDFSLIVGSGGRQSASAVDGDHDYIDEAPHVYFLQHLANTPPPPSSSSAAVPRDLRRGSVNLHDQYPRHDLIHKSEATVKVLHDFIRDDWHLYPTDCAPFMRNLYDTDEAVLEDACFQYMHQISPEELSSFQSDWVGLLQEEERFLAKLEQAMIAEGLHEEYQRLSHMAEWLHHDVGKRIFGEGLLFDCGIGRQSGAVAKIRDRNVTMGEALMREKAVLDGRMQRLLEETMLDVDPSEDQMCILVKLFDPYHLFHHRTFDFEGGDAKAGCHLPLSVPITEAAAVPLLPTDRLSMDLSALGAEQQTNFFIGNCGRDNYSPLKHAGYMMMETSSSLSRLVEQVRLLLAMNNVWIDRRLIGDLNCWEFYHMETFQRFKKLEMDSSESGNIGDLCNNESMILVAALDPVELHKRVSGSSQLPFYTSPLAATKARVPIAASAIYRHRSDRYNNLRLSLRDIVRFNRFYARLESQKDRTVQLSSLNIWGEHYHRALPSLLAEEREENITPEECPGEGMDGEEKLLFSPPAYLRYCFTRRAFTILPLEARDVRVLLSVHRYFNLHGISTATLPGAQAGIEPSGPRKRSFAQVDGSSSMDKDTMKVCLGVGLHVYIPHSLSMQDVVALIANKLDVHYAHLMLYFSQAEGLSVLDHLTTGGSPAHAFIDCSLNEYLQSQRLQRQSTLAIYYAVLPHPLHRLISPLPSRSRPPALYTAETPAELYSTPFDDLPRCRQSLSLIISDARLRQWRRFFLADLDLQIARQNRSLSESEYAVRNEEVIELVDDEGDEDANVASAKNEPNKRLRGASSPVSSGGQPALAEEAVQSSDLYEDLMLSDGAMTRLYFPGKRMYLDNPYLPQDLGTLSVEVETAAPIFEVCTAVRAALGIPVNLTALMKEGDTEVASVYHHLYAGAAEKESEELSAARRAAHIPTATCCPAISEEVRGEAMLHPLILLLIHDGIAEEVLDALTSIADYGVAGVGVGALSSALGRRIAVQTVAPADLPALLPDVNAHPTMDDDTEDGHMPLVRPVAVERIAVSCFFFTLYGNSVEVCPESAFSGPFVSHVTAQDQHASLLERLARITGDRALAQGRYRVAVVSRKREVMAWLRPDESVFETIARCHRSSVGVRGDRGRRFAWLGIQRSVSDVQAALQGTIHAFRYLGATTSGIKIT